MHRIYVTASIIVMAACSSVSRPGLRSAPAGGGDERADHDFATYHPDGSPEMCIYARMDGPGAKQRGSVPLLFEDFGDTAVALGFDADGSRRTCLSVFGAVHDYSMCKIPDQPIPGEDLVISYEYYLYDDDEDARELCEHYGGQHHDMVDE